MTKKIEKINLLLYLLVIDYFNLYSSHYYCFSRMEPTRLFGSLPLDFFQQVLLGHRSLPQLCESLRSKLMSMPKLTPAALYDGDPTCGSLKKAIRGIQKLPAEVSDALLIPVQVDEEKCFACIPNRKRRHIYLSELLAALYFFVTYILTDLPSKDQKALLPLQGILTMEIIRELIRVGRMSKADKTSSHVSQAMDVSRGIVPRIQDAHVHESAAGSFAGGRRNAFRGGRGGARSGGFRGGRGGAQGRGRGGQAVISNASADNLTKVDRCEIGKLCPNLNIMSSLGLSEVLRVAQELVATITQLQKDREAQRLRELEAQRQEAKDLENAAKLRIMIGNSRLPQSSASSDAGSAGSDELAELRQALAAAEKRTMEQSAKADRQHAEMMQMFASFSKQQVSQGSSGYASIVQNSQPVAAAAATAATAVSPQQNTLVASDDPKCTCSPCWCNQDPCNHLHKQECFYACSCQCVCGSTQCNCECQGECDYDSTNLHDSSE